MSAMQKNEHAGKVASIGESVSVHINGQAHHLAAGQTVAAVLTTLKLPVERVAIELNRTIVRKRDWESTLVGDGAQMEIVEFVGGG